MADDLSKEFQSGAAADEATAHEFARREHEVAALDREEFAARMMISDPLGCARHRRVAAQERARAAYEAALRDIWLNWAETLGTLEP